MRSLSGMCIINRTLVEDIEPLVGSQAEVMQRLGISWNCWIKIVAGLPIRRSVGERLRDRTMGQAALLEGLRNKFPCRSAPDGINRAALERDFILPATPDDAKPLQAIGHGLRSVRRARSVHSSAEAVG